MKELHSAIRDADAPPKFAAAAATELKRAVPLLAKHLGLNSDAARLQRELDEIGSLLNRPGPKGPHGWDATRWTREYAAAEAEIQRLDVAGNRVRRGKRATDAERMELMHLEDGSFYSYLRLWGRPT